MIAQEKQAAPGKGQPAQTSRQAGLQNNIDVSNCTSTDPSALTVGADWAVTIAQATKLTGQHQAVFDMTKAGSCHTFIFQDAGIMQPGARVNELNNQGFRFDREAVEAPDTKGRLKRVMQYKLLPSSWLDFALAADSQLTALRLAGNWLEKAFKGLGKAKKALPPPVVEAFGTIRAFLTQAKNEGTHRVMAAARVQ